MSKSKFDWTGLFIALLPFAVIIAALIIGIWFPQLFGY